METLQRRFHIFNIFYIHRGQNVIVDSLDKIGCQGLVPRAWPIKACGGAVLGRESGIPQNGARVGTVQVRA
ncbi:unnamed protein product [Brassica rapa]|uniref:Uncharacterized protein n=1 Tax=Brassica campestris TaxID=3711 RepID=A0A8D9HN34_BRACM|nr:unnamed protein product [Brassica rapa]